MLRGCFLPAEANDPLASGVPTFATTKDALEWSLALSRQPSNPTIPTLLHSITTLVGRKQTFELLEPRIRQVTVPRAVFCVCNTSRNRFVDSVVHYGITQRLEAEYHSRLSSESTMNSLMYAFDHMRCGILVQIRSRKIVTFAPFVNDEYRNNWAHKLTTEPTPLETYYAEKLRYYRAENIIDPVSAWWANGNIICNEHETGANKTTQWWGDNLLLPFKHMLETVCRERKVPDCDFLFNKRDHPQLRRDLTEPYDFLFDRRGVPLPGHYRLGALAPFVSFYASPNFSDLPVPTNEDWRGAVGEVFPDSSIPPLPEPSDLYTATNFAQFRVRWEEKAPTAFFRGNATGGGTRPDNNQRLALARLSVEWAAQRAPAETTPPLLDAGVTGFNLRDKKVFGEPMRFANPADLDRLKANFVPMYKQSTFKYIVYVDGHCAANRYAFLMRLGSVIVRVASACEASELWFFPVLRAQDCSRDLAPGEKTHADHVLVRADLADLKEKLEWCRRNDHAGRQIAANAADLYERFVSRDAILDYWQLLMCEVSKRTVSPPPWFSVPEDALSWARREPPRAQHALPCAPDGSDCARCAAKRVRLREEQERAASAAAEAAANAASAASAAGDDDAAQARGAPLSSSRSAATPTGPPKPHCRRCKRAEDACRCEAGPALGR